MTFSSEKLAYDGKKYTLPIWRLDTDTFTVIHINEATHKEERTPFISESVRYHIKYTVEHCPERFETLVNKGEILSYLSELEDNVDKAVDAQLELWKQTDKEYLAAQENNDTLQQAGILNMLELRAKEIIFENMVYA